MNLSDAKYGDVFRTVKGHWPPESEPHDDENARGEYFHYLHPGTYVFACDEGGDPSSRLMYVISTEDHVWTRIENKWSQQYVRPGEVEFVFSPSAETVAGLEHTPEILRVRLHQLLYVTAAHLNTANIDDIESFLAD